MKWINLGFLSGFWLFCCGQVAMAEPTTCAYNPDSGLPNPLGMRAFITLTATDSNTTVLFEQFPSPVGGGEPPATIASTREITFYGVGIEEARTLMLQTAEYYTELVGYEDPDGFAPVNATLVCR